MSFPSQSPTNLFFPKHHPLWAWEKQDCSTSLLSKIKKPWVRTQLRLLESKLPPFFKISHCQSKRKRKGVPYCFIFMGHVLLIVRYLSCFRIVDNALLFLKCLCYCIWQVLEFLEYVTNKPQNVNKNNDKVVYKCLVIFLFGFNKA